MSTFSVHCLLKVRVHHNFRSQSYVAGKGCVDYAEEKGKSNNRGGAAKKKDP